MKAQNVSDRGRRLSVLVVAGGLSPAVSVAGAQGRGRMGMGGGMMGGGLFGILFALLFWAVLVALLIALVLWIVNQTQQRR